MNAPAPSALASVDPMSENLAPPAPLGLFALGITLGILILQTRGWLNFETWLLVILVLYGSVALILIGWSEWRQQNFFGAQAYVCCGLFCLSQIALVVFPRTGFGDLPSPQSMAAYLGLWALFGSVLCAGARSLALGLQGVFVLLTLHLTLHTFALGLTQPLLGLAADAFGLAAAACAIYCSLAICLNASRNRTILPLGPRTSNNPPEH